MDKLQLGKGKVFSGGKWNLFAPSTQAALKLYTAGQWHAAAGKCAALTRKNKKRWFEEIWKWQISNGFKPEESDLLRPLGKSKAKKTPKWCKSLHPATQTANVRAQIKARLWEAFDNVFRP
jgi:hypothetical protein